MLRVLFSAFVLAAYCAAQPLGAQTRTTAPDASTVKGPIINLNTATAAELETLPGVGAKMAARIIDYRQKKGPFKKIEELMNVQGIGEKSFLKLRAQLTVASKPDATGQQ